jgi:4-hydroxythreonine-4-phosphate dehydrogenase
MKKIAISIGDLNGIGLEIALNSHQEIKKYCQPIYCINKTMLTWGAAILDREIPQDFEIEPCGKNFEITPSLVSKASGKYAYDSFKKAINLAKKGKVDAISTLPINKEAWAKAKVPYKGHTDALADILHTQTIMMLGCEKLFCILYTHHIPLKDVASKIKLKKLKKFLLDVYRYLNVSKIAVLGLNPHAGDNGVIGKEDIKIKRSIELANKKLKNDVFIGPMVPDTAFCKQNTQNFTYFICMYHDQGLIPLKTLYFDESINVSLNEKIIRTSVDHGTAFDIAYQGKNPTNVSYINAIKQAVTLANLYK